MKKNNLYMIFTVLFVTCLLLANIAAAKLFSLGTLTLTAGVLLFPITYIVNDVLSEVYGFKKARTAITLGFAMNILMVAYFSLTIILPYPVFFQNQEAYATILGNTPRILVASLIAYLVGSTLNAKVLTTMKGNIKDNKGLFARCVVSTLVGEFVDSLLFVTIGFFATMPTNALLIMVVTQACCKTLYEIVVYPVTSKVISKVKQIEGV